MDNNRQIEQVRQPAPALPSSARLPLNHCNLPAAILGSLAFQAHPVPLEIDGIRDFHTDLFQTLDTLSTPMERAQRFMDYMTVHFLLEELEGAGLTPGRKRKSRINANYLRMVRGWSFDSDGREGAVLKRWVESRFGLLARHHAGSLLDRHSETYHQYLAQGTRGLYATNALEAQLDLLYTYCQYELWREHEGWHHLTLYRGINRIDAHEVLETVAGGPGADYHAAPPGPGAPRSGTSVVALSPEAEIQPSPNGRGSDRGHGQHRVLLNNLNSFTRSRERADEFGDYILAAKVPLPKVFFYNKLLPGMFKGEDEYVVIGGAYQVCISTI